MSSKIKVNCTGCKYCIPCPVGVKIPTCFELLNNSSMFNSIDNSIEKTKETYKGQLVKENLDAYKCAKCGVYEDKCPQYINIIEKLK